MPRRNEETFPEVLFDFLRHLPWWVGPIVIAVTFVVLRWAMPALIDVPQPQFDPSTPEKGVGYASQILGKAGADFSRLAAPWVTLGVTVVWLFALAAKYMDTRKRSDSLTANRPRPQ